MMAYRIADPRHKIYDATGAMLKGGRWNSIGTAVIYAAQTFAGAMLEILVHANASRPPKKHQLVRITIPEDVAIEKIEASALPGRDAPDCLASKAFGDQWVKDMRTAVLIVPATVTYGFENNVLINPLHPQFSLIVPGAPEPIMWDDRFFSSK